MEDKTVLAIDPGRSKCGLALAHRTPEGKVVLDWRTVCPREKLLEMIEEAGAKRRFSMIILGSGTTSRTVIDDLREAMPSVGILLVDEENTTLQARERYWEHNPRRGWRRLLPATLQEPPEPVDDFAALILAERVLAG